MTVGSVFATIQDIGPYHYVPTKWICILFLVLYGISTILHMGQAIKYRLWWMIPTAALAGVMEVFGWSARLWSSYSPTLLTPFEMQLVGTVLAPTPLVAANFIILGKIINQLGPQFSRLTPKLYTILFCTFDVICLVVQAVGGASAASAVNRQTNANMGGNIMLGGIVAQLFGIIVYVVVAAEFFWRFRNNAPVRHADISEKNPRSVSKNLRVMVLGMGFCTLCILIRSVYRTVELANGWDGTVIATQRYFNWLDGGMVTLAIYTLNFIHPGVWLKIADPTARAAVDEEASAS
ncbi:hypothetical protein AZE42_09914 [Rhizopogon vesiculosus]|uniref:RTA1 like protein n=1 Tax=Rhizopogon vesiculosus TaxID=180088 RepID=A0A1J8QG08_9AGAM|nr:hypothetical protein AZE42_09914 [Rhizopogon vesiculosus]